MTIDEAIRRIGEIGIVPVVRAANFDEARRTVDAICAGGIAIVEITMTVPDATTVIKEIVRQYGDKVLTGAGTVLSADDARTCLDAGAEFIVSPGLNIPVMHAVQARGKLAIPGALTPTELMAAHSEEAKLVKIFPCGNVGGPKYINALLAPFPRMALIPTGGVNLSNAAEYVVAGAFALGVGADLADLAAIRAGNPQRIVETAQALVEAVRHARESGSSATKHLPHPAR